MPAVPTPPSLIISSYAAVLGPLALPLRPTKNILDPMGAQLPFISAVPRAIISLAIRKSLSVTRLASSLDRGIVERSDGVGIDVIPIASRTRGGRR